MAKAILCPGQGSQFVGMGADLVEVFPSARELYERANSVLGWSVSELSFSGPEERLMDTRFTQPALFVQSCAAGAVLHDIGIRFDCAAGHSLGEYSALSLAGVFSFEDGLRLVVERANAMADAGIVKRGTMAAIIGLDEATVEDAVSEINGVVTANFNSPDQVVISGNAVGVSAACRKLEEIGAKRVVPLNVSGAFHSPLVATAATRLESALESVDMHAPSIPVISNVTAEPVTCPDDIRRLMVLQLTSPVLWTGTMRTLRGLGVDEALEVGPGKVLQGLARKTDRTLRVSSAGTAADMHGLQKG